jgi:hypothetical protein
MEIFNSNIESANKESNKHSRAEHLKLKFQHGYNSRLGSKERLVRGLRV